MPKRKKRTKFYFDCNVEEAIIKFNNETDHLKRNKIYNEEIKYALEKLAENIINTFKFPYVIENFANKKADVVSHLILNLNKYEQGKGKAYSYFGQAAKNYLIMNNTSNYKKMKTDKSIYDSEDEQGTNEIFEIEDFNEVNRNLQNDKREFIEFLVTYLDNNLNRIFKKTVEIKIANAIIQLLQNYDMFIENFNKKNLYILIKEMTRCKAIHITKVLDKIKIVYFELREEYNLTGKINTNYKKSQ